MMKCTVVIPTYNRPTYLKRVLSYYHQYGNDLPIIIADSSSEENKRLNREIISSFHDTSFSYLDKYDTNTHPFYKIIDALQQLSTEYCVLCADDDFVTLNGINQSVDFLEHNHDYTVAHGSYIYFRLEGNGQKKRYFWLNIYCPPEFNSSFNSASGLRNCYTGSSITFPGAVERLRYKLADYPIPTFYAVHRTDFLRLALEETMKNTSDDSFGELLPTLLTIIHGKMKCLDVLYSARDASSAGTVYARLIKYLDAAKYNEEYAKFKDCLSMHLSAESGLDKEASGKVIDDAMASYLRNTIRETLTDKIRAVLNYSYVPDWMYKGIRTLYRKMFPWWLRSNSSVFTDSYPSSKYRNDFEQIRQIVLAHDYESKLSK